MKKMKTKQTKKISKLNAWVFNFFLISFLTLGLHWQTAEAIVIQKFERNVKTGYAVRTLVEKLPRAKVEENLREFVKISRPSRLLGSEGHNKARAFLESKLKLFSINGGSYSKEEFSSLDNINGMNFIWEKKGILSPDEVIILGANYDTFFSAGKSSVEMPGADNNASGVAILLSMIELLAELELPKSIKIVFLDAEEPGALGSQDFVKKLMTNIGNQKIVGFINLTMLAHDTKVSDLEKRLNNFKLYMRTNDQALASLVTSAGKRLYGNMEFKETVLSTEKKFPATIESFWSLGLPAITLSQNREGDLNPRHNTSNDFVETLNFNVFNNTYRYVTAAVLSWNYGIVK